MSVAGMVLLLVVVFIASHWLTGRLRLYALRRQVLDIPNARSSHTVVTPRGGGVAIVLTALSAFLIVTALGDMAGPTGLALLGGGALVAAIGFVDDHGDISPPRRLLAHFAAAGWILWWLGGLPVIAVPGGELDLGWLGHGLAAVYLVWLLNLTNFMDGIDGIAGVETVSVSLGAVLIHLAVLPGNTSWIGPMVLAAATLGFLVWNLPPARIFMGDAGSGFLGLMLGALSLQAAWQLPVLLWSWAILLGAFVVDATVTLIRRITRGERFSEAHRTHAYQHAARRLRAHRPVTIAVGAINIGWLLPVAAAVALGYLDGLTGVLIAYAPLVAAAIWLRAGVTSAES